MASLPLPSISLVTASQDALDVCKVMAGMPRDECDHLEVIHRIQVVMDAYAQGDFDRAEKLTNARMLFAIVLTPYLSPTGESLHVFVGEEVPKLLPILDISEGPKVEGFDIPYIAVSSERWEELESILSANVSIFGVMAIHVGHKDEFPHGS